MSFPIVPYLWEASAAQPVSLLQRRLTEPYPAHGHDYFELELVVSGSGRQWLNGEALSMEPGCLYLLSPADFHRLEPNASLDVFSFHFTPEYAAQLGFSLDAQTQAAIRRCAPLCASLSRERVREEAEKTLLSDRPEYFGRMLAEGLLGACIRAENADFSGLSALPKTPEARWTAAKLRCPAFDPAAFRLPAKLCRLIELTAQTWREGRTEAEWKRLIAEHGWETAHLQADLQRTDTVRQIELRGDCVTLCQLAVTGADFPTLCGKDVGRMLHLLLVYALEHPDQNTKTQLLAAAPSLWQEENKIQG